MKKYLDVLQQCPLFRGVRSEELEPLLSCMGGIKRRCLTGQTVLEEGEPANRMGIVLTGRVQIVQVDYYGNRSIVGTVGPGELFGESFACAQVEHLPVSVIAGEETEALLIPSSRVVETCGNACSFHQRVIYNLMQITAAKNLILHQKNQILSRRTTREKLLSYLMMQARQKGSSRFDIPYDRQELADYLAVDRSGLSAEIGKLCRQGVIKSHRKSFELL